MASKSPSIKSALSPQSKHSTTPTNKSNAATPPSINTVPGSPHNGPHQKRKLKPCPFPCAQVPKSVPKPEAAQTVLHPRKDVFVLKVSKVNAAGERNTKMELELVTPKAPDRRPPHRLDTRETQYTRPNTPCCSHCCSPCRSCPRKGTKKGKGKKGGGKKKKK